MLNKYQGFGRLAVSALLISSMIGAGAWAADPPPKKKPNYPPPEQSSTIGQLGSHRASTDNAALPAEPPPPVAAPAVPKVEAEMPTQGQGMSGYGTQGGDPAGANGAMSPLAHPAVPTMAPTGYLTEHPYVSGLIAGLIGTDLGARLYGGPMMGDSDAATIGFVARIGIILGIALLLFRAIGGIAASRAPGSAAPQRRREPGFGKGPDAGNGRREPTLSARRDR